MGSEITPKKAVLLAGVRHRHSREKGGQEGGDQKNADGLIVFPDGLRMYLQRDIKTGAQRFQK